MLTTRGNYKDELEKTEQKLREVTKERDELKANFQKLSLEHDKCSDIHINLVVEFFYNQIRPR